MVTLICKRCGADSAIEGKCLKRYHNFCSSCGFNEFTLTPESPQEKRQFKGRRTWVGSVPRLPQIKSYKHRINGGIFWPSDFKNMPKNTLILIGKGVVIWDKKKQ
jgi:hypothetical protein